MHTLFSKKRHHEVAKRRRELMRIPRADRELRKEERRDTRFTEEKRKGPDTLCEGRGEGEGEGVTSSPEEDRN